MAAEVTPGQVEQARKDLGRRLAAWRVRAGLTQWTFASRMRFSRSTVANVETGRQRTVRAFWQRADAGLGAGGELLRMFDDADALERDLQAQTARKREQQRQHRQQRWHAAAHAAGDDVCAGGGLGQECGCVVGRWTLREVRALREASRMSVRAFAEYLGMSVSAVTCWERRRAPKVPTLATQAVLDQALKLADADAKARFALILALPDGAGDEAPARAATVTGGSVTAIHLPQRIRAAS